METPYYDMVVSGDWLGDAWWFVNRPDSHALRKLFLLTCQCLKTKLICLVTSRSFKYEDENSNIFPKDQQKKKWFSMPSLKLTHIAPENNFWLKDKPFLLGQKAPWNFQRNRLEELFGPCWPTKIINHWTCWDSIFGSNWFCWHDIEKAFAETRVASIQRDVAEQKSHELKQFYV